jgi:multiple sugar transport system substrate-binding protein
LTGIGWDHPRGFGCYEGSGVAFMREHPDIELVWEKRSLRAFGEAPIDDLAELYDLVVFDHPFVGRAHATRAFLDLKEIVPDVVSAALADELGQAARSYHFAGGVYGLPTDAAAQVSAYRADIMESLGLELPRNHGEVMDLARRLRELDRWIAVPACPTDAICLVMSYSANLGELAGQREGDFLDASVLRDVLAMLREMVRLAHPESLKLNPIQTLEAMVGGDEIVYVPAAFGYSNYARRGRVRRRMIWNRRPNSGAEVLGSSGLGYAA